MFYTSGDARLFYEQQGGGPDVVLLHPTPVHHGFWLPAAVQLISGYRVTARICEVMAARSRARASLISSGWARTSSASSTQPASRPPSSLAVPSEITHYTSFGGKFRIVYRPSLSAAASLSPIPWLNRAKRTEDIETIRVAGTTEFFDRMTQTLVGADFRGRVTRRSPRSCAP